VQKPCFCICRESTAFALHWPTKNLSFPPAQSIINRRVANPQQKALMGVVCFLGQYQRFWTGRHLLFQKWRIFRQKRLQIWKIGEVYDTKSTISVPLSVGKGPIFGVLTFASIREERKWTDEIIEEFQLIAQIFANALLRKKTEVALLENQKRLTIATEAANAGLWNIELEYRQGLGHTKNIGTVSFNNGGGTNN
jgi:hypothetical protein